jgi:hypothetical protein
MQPVNSSSKNAPPDQGDGAEQEYDELDEGDFSDSEEGFNIKDQLLPAHANILSTSELHGQSPIYLNVPEPC